MESQILTDIQLINTEQKKLNYRLSSIKHLFKVMKTISIENYMLAFVLYLVYGGANARPTTVSNSLPLKLFLFIYMYIFFSSVSHITVFYNTD